MKWLLFPLLLATPALAQSPQQSADNPAPGPLHSCVTYYPPIAVRTHAQGETTLAFQVTAAGAVTNITVKKSSGHPVLDDASVKCVEQWRYGPKTENDTPADKQVNIVWRLSDSTLLYAVESAAVDCIRKVRPSAEAIAKASKDTVVQIQFNRKRYAYPFSGGGPPSVQMVSSSGNNDLDNLVVGCVKHLPPDLGIDTTVTLDFIIPFSWRPNQPNAASASSLEK